MKHRLAPLLILALCLAISAAAQKVAPELLTRSWPARWIAPHDTGPEQSGVYLYRKTFTLTQAPGDFIIHVSADNRYKLFVNGSYVGNGPVRGDLMKWYFETYNIAPLLKAGTNVIAAVVWNFANSRPVAQFSAGTGLIIQGNSTPEAIVNTDKSWSVSPDEAYSLLPVNVNAYYVVGPGEKFDAAFHPWKWMSADFDASAWPAAAEGANGMPARSHKQFGDPAARVLYPRQLPAMEETVQYFGSVRRSNPVKVPAEFLRGQKPLTIPAQQTARILLDQQVLTTAYPVLEFSRGKGATMKITYAESLFDDQKQKGNRNDVEGKTIFGNTDLVVSDGGLNRVVQTLWWRTFRYVELEITTREEPLTLHSVHSVFTAYPFREKATFRSSDPSLTTIWNTGWRTQRLCAAETYFDCPYYEQLQYAGDTRIQAFISTYVSGDTRLVKSALESFRESHLPFGLTQSRYPSYHTQVIPPFSLIWIMMMHDYWMLNGDADFVRSTIPVIMDVLQWYEARVDSTGTLGHMEWWNFVDWVNHPNWVNGIPPGVPNGNSAIISLQYVYALTKAAELLDEFDLQSQANRYRARAESVKKSVYQQCYDAGKGLVADVPTKDNFSQHANVMAILTNTVPEAEQQALFRQLMQQKDIARCSFYFQFYLIEAMRKCGLADEYTAMLTPWRTMVQNGLTTFAEQADPTRSDCHAWSASPVYHMLSLVAGITPAAPGFSAVRIEPHLGTLEWFECTMPHPKGEIAVTLRKTRDGSIKGQVNLPSDLQGTFVWKGKIRELGPGANKIE